MIHLFVYLIEASICLSLLLIVYLIFIKNDTFYKLKRFYLLISVAVSLIIPQLPSVHFLSTYKEIITSNISNNDDYEIYADSFERIVFGKMPIQSKMVKLYSKNYSNLLLLAFLIIYITGICIMICKLSSNLYEILKLIKTNKNESFGRYTIIHHKTNYPSFSFLKYIFLNNDDAELNDKNTVLLHEKIHLKQGHSVDILFIELCKIVFWFNPIIWIYKKSLLKVHECQVDKHIIDSKTENTTSYQELLLKQYLILLYDFKKSLEFVFKNRAFS